MKDRPLHADIPIFSTEKFHTSGLASIDRIVEVESVDVVILSGGLRQGLRNGMVCEVLRENREIGEIILVDVKLDIAAGLITQLEESVSIRPGDWASIKAFKFNG